MTENLPGKTSVKSRLAAELKSYAMISSYLFVCFSVILLYETSLLPAAHASVLEHGLALGKALIIGKFILIGEALDAGSRVSAPTLLFRVGSRSISMMVVLLALKVIEELVIGWVHGSSAAAVFSEMAAKPWVGLLAPVLMMLLILIPLITATELNRAMPGGKLKQMLFSKLEE